MLEKTYPLNLNTSPFSDFVKRHIGPDETEQAEMLGFLGLSSLDELIDKTIPSDILLEHELDLAEGKAEHEVLNELKSLAQQNQIYKSYIGMGYYPCFLPAVIKRNVLENPGWYTAYTPYQSEISQGRLEALLNFQQMVIDLTGMEIANASLLDEATAAAEAMTLCKRAGKSQAKQYFVAQDVHPQTLDVLRTRARYLGFDIIVGEPLTELDSYDIFGLQLQYPGSTGELVDIEPLIAKAHAKGALVSVASDLLALVKLKAPGEMNADVVFGNSQRFGVPMGFGGPHAAFFATRDAFKRSTPGRIIGVSQDSRGKTALRMAMQTREQHIRREKATSNICTAQALLANIAGFYAVYHGPEGLKAIANRVHDLTNLLAHALANAGYQLKHSSWFDTICIKTEKAQELYEKALQNQLNFRLVDQHQLALSLDETTSLEDLTKLLTIFNAKLPARAHSSIPKHLERQSDFLTHPVFHRYRSETEMLRYLKSLENKDFSLTHGMIPLGSCTMKLNATSEMEAISWPEFADIHPFAPKEQSRGYRAMISELSQQLCTITGFDAMSMQPNSGAQGEYAGLLAIRRYQESQGQGQRTICLIPSSAHGTNPASARMMGLEVVVVKTTAQGNIDLEDLKKHIANYQQQLSCLMLTYPSTHGVFEEQVQEICQLVHQAGAQVYMDGANLNAQVGLTHPARIGADVSHLNLHKTFCIPHGGGGPGMGPIGVKAHLAPFLANHVMLASELAEPQGAVSATPFGSALILPISWAYIKLMGLSGLKRATQIAILNANYLAKALEPHYPVVYKGKHGLVAHECIIDLREIKESTGISEEDVAKRLMDYGFHAPTMSWPVAGTMMIEPTESESKAELDRFIHAMISIRDEIRAIERGEIAVEASPVHHAPHTLDDLVDPHWQRSYSREQAVFPSHYERKNKFWPSVNRIDNSFGDRHFICTCPPMEAYSYEEAFGD